MKICAKRLGVYAYGIGFFVCAQVAATEVFGKDSKEGKSPNSPNATSSSVKSVSSEFQWKDHGKLSWDDFQGPVNANNDESAAATHCGIGFRINRSSQSGKPEVVVYNTFYVNKSWVRSDARIESILDHEQGHFDLCELYTRKLRHKINNFGAGVTDLKAELMKAFSEVNNEYEMCQQQYEDQTTHGTKIRQQKMWQEKIQSELELYAADKEIVLNMN